MIYDNIFVMVDSMKEHHNRFGHRLRVSDDPFTRMIGFCTDEGPVEEWRIGLTALKRSLILTSDPRIPLLRELLPTHRGRLRLVESINQGQPLV